MSTVLWHVSPIKIRGRLRTACSRGKLPVIWLHTPSVLQWVIEHMIDRYPDADKLYLYRVKSHRRDRIRFRRGLWMSRVDCPILDRIVLVDSPQR